MSHGNIRRIPRSCVSYHPGHQVHWIHAKKAHEPQPEITVVVTVHDDGRVELDGDDLHLSLWNHGPAWLQSASRERLVLFGGQVRGNPMGDTWEWDGVAWIARRRRILTQTCAGDVGDVGVRLLGPNPAPPHLSDHDHLLDDAGSPAHNDGTRLGVWASAVRHPKGWLTPILGGEPRPVSNRGQQWRSGVSQSRLPLDC